MGDPVKAAIASFASYLEASGPGQVAERKRHEMGADAFDALHKLWSGRITTPGTTPDQIEAALGPPQSRDAFTLAYQLPTRRGYHYVFEYDTSGRTLKRSGFRRTGSVTPPTKTSDVASYKQKLIEIGATDFELDEWLGRPADRYGWWPEEVLDYPNGLSLRLRHGVVEADYI